MENLQEVVAELVQILSEKGCDNWRKSTYDEMYCDDDWEIRK